jgi:hypothetical protein
VVRSILWRVTGNGRLPEQKVLPRTTAPGSRPSSTVPGLLSF